MEKYSCVIESSDEFLETLINISHFFIGGMGCPFEDYRDENTFSLKIPSVALRGVFL